MSDVRTRVTKLEKDNLIKSGEVIPIMAVIKREGEKILYEKEGEWKEFLESEHKEKPIYFIELTT